MFSYYMQLFVHYITLNVSHLVNIFKWMVSKEVFLVLKFIEGRKEMFYLATHSTLFIYGYMSSDIW